jgi:hypothetical protein
MAQDRIHLSLFPLFLRKGSWKASFRDKGRLNQFSDRLLVGY